MFSGYRTGDWPSLRAADRRHAGELRCCSRNCVTAGERPATESVQPTNTAPDVAVNDWRNTMALVTQRRPLGPGPHRFLHPQQHPANCDGEFVLGEQQPLWGDFTNLITTWQIT